MAGGLFGRAFAFNEKCIVFSIIIMALFLYKPNFRNQYFLYFTLFIIFIIAYVAMAWYDYAFNCDIAPLKKGKAGGISGQLKPPSHEKDKQENNKSGKKDIKIRNFVIYGSHLLFIVPLLIYISVYKKKINPLVYPILGVLAIFTAGYHGIAMINGSHI
tara:strand:+ start:5266 stop:5742 length:477 start_codon:yes stop_codon:yes gene_type:complete